MNPVKKYNYCLKTVVAILSLTFVSIPVVLFSKQSSMLGVWNLLPLNLFIFELLVFIPIYMYYVERALDAQAIKLILRDYPELQSWFETHLDGNNLVNLNMVQKAISKIVSEEAELKRVKKKNALLEEQRRAFK